MPILKQRLVLDQPRPIHPDSFIFLRDIFNGTDLGPRTVVVKWLAELDHDREVVGSNLSKPPKIFREILPRITVRGENSP